MHWMHPTHPTHLTHLTHLTHRRTATRRTRCTRCTRRTRRARFTLAHAAPSSAPAAASPASAAVTGHRALSTRAGLRHARPRRHVAVGHPARRWCGGRRRVFTLAFAARRRLHHFGPVLDDAFERAHAALAEVEPARQRFHFHAQVLRLDPHARGLEHEVVEHFVVERVPLRPRLVELDLAAGFALEQVDVEQRLRVQDLVEHVQVEEQLQDRLQQLAHEAQRPAVRRDQRLVVEGVRRFDLRRLGVHRRPALAELLQQVRSQVLRLEEFLEPDRRQLPDLIFGVVGAALLENARADLLHDLLDVDRLGTNGELAHRYFL